MYHSVLRLLQPYKTFLASSMLVLSGSGAVNVLNYAFNVSMSRLLTPADFGTVASLFSLFTILTVPSATITTYVSRFAAQNGDRQ
jgi:O-antigen/teichoic acid export membrane protein